MDPHDSTPSEAWPPIPYKEWEDTCSTLHMWTQIAGKVRFALTPWVNHSWSVVFYLTSRGLTTSPIPYGRDSFQMGFDFIDHEFAIARSDGGLTRLKLQPQSVADFYAAVMEALEHMGIRVHIDR